MNEHKHGDAYKAGMLRRMLAHEMNACEEHYGARLSHHDVSIKHLTIDAGGIATLIRYYENHDTDLDGGVPEFELFDDELEAAYRKREHEYRLSDAETQLSAFFGINTEKESPFADDGRNLRQNVLHALRDTTTVLRMPSCKVPECTPLDRMYHYKVRRCVKT